MDRIVGTGFIGRGKVSDHSQPALAKLDGAERRIIQL